MAIVGDPYGAAGAVLGQIAGAGITSIFGDKAADDAWKRQKKILQNSVQWRVEDAIKAGIHPLAALGLNPAQGPAAAQIGDFGDMGASAAARQLQYTPESTLVRQRAAEDLNAQYIQAQIGEIKSRTAANLTGAGVGAAGSNRIGNIDIPAKDKNYADKVTSVVGDGVASVLGWLKFFELSNKQVWKDWPWSKGPFGTGWPTIGKSKGTNMGVPEGYLGRR